MYQGTILSRVAQAENKAIPCAAEPALIERSESNGLARSSQFWSGALVKGLFQHPAGLTTVATQLQTGKSSFQASLVVDGV